MLLGITVLGWIIIAVVYLPLLTVLALLTGRASRRSRVILLGLALLPLVAVVAEAVYVDGRYEALCKNAGINVSRRVTTDGYFDGRDRDWSKSPGDFAKTGFRYIEWQDHSKRYYRIERKNGDVVVVLIEGPGARYSYYPADSDQWLAHLINGTEEQVIDTESQEVLGRITRVYRYPAFVDRLWWQFFDPVPTVCPKMVPSLRESVLVPPTP